MPGAVAKTPMKRVLAEATNTRTNVQSSPRSAKKLKLDNGVNTNGNMRAPPKMANGSFSSSQPQKSRFEEEVLEKMSQDIETLKQTNSERDQQWKRPPLPQDFDEMRNTITFQQIDAEEGVLNGGKGTVKLFGVTEVSSSLLNVYTLANNYPTERPFRTPSRHGLSPLLLRRCTNKFPQK